MRITYIPQDPKGWQIFLHHQINQSGHGINGFVGSRYQRGSGIGSIFGSLLRSVLPIAKSAGKAIGKEALRTGMSVASDALAGENFKQSLENNARASASRLLNKANRRISSKPNKKRRQRGAGLGSRPVKRSVASLTKNKKSKPRKPVIRRKKLRADQLGVYLA